jgi:hypothetical protein
VEKESDFKQEIVHSLDEKNPKKKPTDWKKVLRGYEKKGAEHGVV